MVLPKNLAGPMKHLSNNWIEPISYKQFTNLLLKKNKYYEEMVKRNGKTDPLRKTLLIIDEAHKLYSASVAASEKPDTNILEEMIQNSYDVSGQNSVRLLVMTATPYTEDGMEMVKLLNLMRLKKDAFPTEFNEFSSKYLNEEGAFTTRGKKAWMNEISGYVSYLNRSKDARNFSYPVIENVYLPMTEEMSEESAKEIPQDGLKYRISELKDEFKAEKAKYRDIQRKKKGEMKVAFKDNLQKAKEEARSDVQKCIKEVEALIEELKATFEANKKDCEQKHSERGHGKAKKDCISDAKDSHSRELAKLKQDKKDCQKIKQEVGKDDIKEELEDKLRDTLQEHLKEFQEKTQEYTELKEKFDEYGSMRKENNKELKTLKPQYVEIRNQLKDLKMRIKKAKAPLKKLKTKADKKKLLDKVREELGEPMKKLREEYMDLKVPMTKMKIENKLLRIKQGATTVGDITQGKVMGTKCGL